MFKGFPKEAFKFFADLEANNNKEWFQKNKDLFTHSILAPLQELVKVIGPVMLTIDDAFEVRPAVNKTVSRIHKDIRFSQGREFYKNKMWMVFKRPIRNWQDSPAFFLEIYASGYRYGMGYYQASPHTMEIFRREVREAPGNFLKAIKGLSRYFEVRGNEYRKQMDYEKLPKEVLTFYQRKSFYMEYKREIDEIVLSDKLAHELKERYLLLKPLYLYLLRLNSLKADSSNFLTHEKIAELGKLRPRRGVDI